MSTVRSSSSINSSVSSSQTSGIEDIEATKVKNYAKDLLKSRIFLGRYLERRLVNPRVGYRDIVLLSPAEVELHKDLTDVQYKLRMVCPNMRWVGITDGEAVGYPSNMCLWSEIDNQPFGAFWFQVRSLKFRDEEIIVTVKCIRHISEAYLELEPILTESAKSSSNVKSVATNPCSNVAINTAAINESWDELVTTLKGALSISNVKEFFTFIFALILAVFTGSTAFVNFLGNFILALIRELSIFVKNSTPLFLGFLDFLSKIVGGFYIVVSMIFRPSRSPLPPNRRAVTYQYDRPHSSNYAYNDKSFD